MALEGLSLVGGRPALDFVNTEGGSRNGPPERIESYADLVAWSEYAGLVDGEAARRLAREGRDQGEAAREVVERAIELRESLYRIFTAVAAGAPGGRPSADEPVPGDLEVLDREVTTAWSRRRLEREGDRFVWRFDGGDARLDDVLLPIVEDAAGLLTSPDALARVKECAGPDCSWLFLDESRNHSRRWCEMGECGNRAKARRYRERHG